MTLPLGVETLTFSYDPLDPPAFEAEGSLRDPKDSRRDILTVYTPPFARDLFVKGRMRARLCVASSAKDTSFYMNISIKKPSFEYLLRHDITALHTQLGSYEGEREVTLDFCFDEHAFRIEAGDALRIDIAATDSNTYVPHTNKAGAYYLQEQTEVAHNKVDLARSQLILPIERPLNHQTTERTCVE